MARQPLIALCACLVVAPGCRDDELYEGAFDLPVAVAVLPTDRGPFLEPVGLAANGHGGQIATLALKQGRFLADDPSASFLRGNWIPTGQARVLSGVAVWAPSRFDVHVFAGDRHFEQLVQVPWIVGSETLSVGGEDRVFPVERPPEAGQPCFVPAGTAWDPADGTPCPGVTWDGIAGIEVKHGYTTTETWVLTWSEARHAWVVEGTRSGRQGDLAYPNVPYKASKRRIGFVPKGNPDALNDGDRIAVTTDNGAIEHDVGGAPQALSMAPDQSALALIVHDRVIDAPVLRWFDPATAAVTDVNLPAGARPVRMAWTEAGDALWVADAGLPVAWELAPGAASPIRHDLPWPVLDLAPLFGEVRQVFAVQDDGRTLWSFDADTDQPIDLNAAVPGDQGLFLGVPITGIEAIPLAYQYPETREVLRERRRIGRGVAVALFSGRVVFAEEETGCLVQDGLGPRTGPNSASLVTTDDVLLDPLVIGGPTMTGNAHNDRHVLVNPCAGIARDESWTVRYDGAIGAWRVRSTTWGDHAALAFEDQRYLSDNGEVSFTIRAGAVPSEDGWTFTFSTDEGALAATGDSDGDGLREIVLGSPGDPVFYQYPAGREEMVEIDWQHGSIGTVDGRTDRAFILLPAMASDNVTRIDPENGAIQARWD